MNRVVWKLQFPNNFDLNILEFAAICGKFRETLADWEISFITAELNSKRYFDI